MRTGADYREALRDGRRIWVLGEGQIDDVTTHPATRPMVEEYVTWYDRHFDPAWQDLLLTECKSGPTPVGYLVPRSANDLARMGRSFSATTFLSAGNITHTPAYGHMIALGVLHAVGQRSASAAADRRMPRHIVRRSRVLAAFLRSRPGPPRSAIACVRIQLNARR